MATSLFDNKQNQPSEEDIKKVLKSSWRVWEYFIDYLRTQHHVIETDWKFYSKKAGWCLKISNEKGKNLAYLLPNDNSFIITINMGVKVKEQVLNASLLEQNRKLIEDAKIYVEGISVLFLIQEMEDLIDVKTILNIRDK